MFQILTFVCLCLIASAQEDIIDKNKNSFAVSMRNFTQDDSIIHEDKDSSDILTQKSKGVVNNEDKKDFIISINNFTQDFLAVSFFDLGDNFVFSPFSLYSVLAILTSGATIGSKTEKQLLAALGNTNKIDTLEKLYRQFLIEYKMSEMRKY